MEGVYDAIMFDALRHFFELNEVIVLFVYGQVFFVMGLAVVLQSRRHSHLELADSLIWLALFGIIHGLHEWGYIFIPVQATYVSQEIVILLQMIQVVLLATSFGCLFAFGADLMRNRWPRMLILPLATIGLWGIWFGVSGMVRGIADETWLREAAIGARYTLGLPASVMAAYGLRHQAEQTIKPLNLGHIYRMLRVAGFTFVGYGILAGLIVPSADFFPASWLNEERVLAVLGTPAPVLRSLAGLIMLTAIIRAMEVFDLEVERLIERMEVDKSLAAERERIGRELHDGAIQQAYTAGLIVQSARRQVEAESIVGQRLDRAMTALSEAIASLRAYMSELRPTPEDVSLQEGLRRQAADPRLSTLLDIRLDVSGLGDVSLDPVQTNHILAIVGEALANAARHAGARRVYVRAQTRADIFWLQVEDDGRGFETKRDGDGYGLRNMRDRARLLGGHLAVESNPGEGTRITLEMRWEES